MEKYRFQKITDFLQTFSILLIVITFVAGMALKIQKFFVGPSTPPAIYSASIVIIVACELVCAALLFISAQSDKSNSHLGKEALICLATAAIWYLIYLFV